jgi:hypothetical protein
MVLRGMRGEDAKTKYLDRLRGLGQGENIGTKGNRPDSIPLYITPFAIPLGANTFIKVSALQPSWDLFKGFSEVAGRVQTQSEMTATEIPIKLSRYKAARVVRRSTTGNTGTKTTSKLTGMKYLKYNTDSKSVPFGKKTGDTSVGSAYNQIVTQASNGQPTSVRFSLIEEDA